ncbi:MAG: LysR family transcriptional regulator [Hyphomicrobiales bacterium]|nr:LysR family transcriptional regulator [Hyphomicrobiales bacterium]
MSRKRQHEPGKPGFHGEIDLRALETFVQIVECGGMTVAAKQLGLTQSAVSQVISGLEASLGVQLFNRTVRPLALTPAGELLHAKAGALLASARDTVFSVREAGGGAMPHLTLALVDSIAATVGPYLVAHLRGLAAHWSVYAGLSAAHNASLRAREADIVISPDALEDEPNLERRLILTEPFVLIVPAAYSGDERSLAAVASVLDLVRFSARSLIGKQVERHLRRIRVEAPGQLEFDTSDALTAMVSGGVGWAITTPLCLLQATSHLSGLRCLPLPGPGCSRSITVLARADELGTIPARIADMSVSILRSVCLPRIAAIAPWMADAIQIGDPATEN